MRISDWSSDVCSSGLANGTPATNFRSVTAPDGSTSRAAWTDLVPHRDDVFIEDFDLFDGFTAVAERSGGLERIRLLKGDNTEEFVKADEDAYSMGLDTNSEHDTPWLRYGYTSMTTPETTYELNVVTGEHPQPTHQPGPDPAPQR